MLHKKMETHPLTWRINKYEEPVSFKDYCKNFGYLALRTVLKNQSPKDIINLILKSGLRGRGGAGFSTGLKWKLMSENTRSEKVKYLICNADEMEPGTYKDRFLLEKLSHQLIEGMVISAFALQANYGYIFLRGEYYVAEKILLKSLKEAENFGYIGKNILNSGFNFFLFLHTGAGRYICGEETALLNSLEGWRANPRFKPPFPAIYGLWGKPTCVNNVETLSNIPAIVLYGDKWYANLSFGKDSGTKMMGFSGKLNNPGLWEVPLGITAEELFYTYAKGMKKNFFLKAWQPGGIGTSFLTVKDLSIPLDYHTLNEKGLRLGTGVAMAVDNSIDMISLLLNIEKFFSRESCGYCTPCRDGLPWIVNILTSFKKKRGNIEDLKILKNLCNTLNVGKTFCAHAPGAITPLSSAIKLFYSDFLKGIKFFKSKEDNKFFISNIF